LVRLSYVNKWKRPRALAFHPQRTTKGSDTRSW
jgi:hypothetical protein